MKEFMGYLISYGLVFWAFPIATCMFNSECNCRDAIKDMHVVAVSFAMAIAMLCSLVYLLAWCFS